MVEYVPEHHLLVVDYIDGHTFTEEDLHDSTNLRRTAEVCRTLHAADRFPTDFNMFDVQRGYLATVQQRGFRLPDRYLEFAPQVEHIRSALAVRTRARCRATTTSSRPTSSTTGTACG